MSIFFLKNSTYPFLIAQPSTGTGTASVLNLQSITNLYYCGYGTGLPLRPLELQTAIRRLCSTPLKGSCALELNLDCTGVSLFLYRPSARRSFRSKPSLHPKASGFLACLSPYGTGFSWQSVRFYTWPQDFSIKFSCQGSKGYALCVTAFGRVNNTSPCRIYRH